MIRFRVSLKPTAKWGLNELYASAKHWTKRGDQAHEVHLLVKQAIRNQNRNIKPFTRPVSVRILYNSRLDLDNHGYLAKLIIDGMKGVLIEDDDRRYVRELVQGFHAGSRSLILVEVKDYEGNG